ncbi:unnamed protein product, partial [Amoebophrya sp. A25]|eukprot:GSA25T00023554001.1
MPTAGADEEAGEDAAESNTVVGSAENKETDDLQSRALAGRHDVGTGTTVEVSAKAAEDDGSGVKMPQLMASDGDNVSLGFRNAVRHSKLLISSSLRTKFSRADPGDSKNEQRKATGASRPKKSVSPHRTRAVKNPAEPDVDKNATSGPADEHSGTAGYAVSGRRVDAENASLANKLRVGAVEYEISLLSHCQRSTDAAIQRRLAEEEERRNR